MIAITVAALLSAHEPAWIEAYRARDSIFSYDAQQTRWTGTTVTAPVKAWLPAERAEDAGGYIYLTEFDCAGRRFRTLYEVVLDHRGDPITEGPALSQDWTPPNEGSGFTEILDRLCRRP